jgi:hypothetical protein
MTTLVVTFAVGAAVRPAVRASLGAETVIGRSQSGRCRNVHGERHFTDKEVHDGG